MSLHVIVGAGRGRVDGRRPLLAERGERVRLVTRRGTAPITRSSSGSPPTPRTPTGSPR